MAWLSQAPSHERMCNDMVSNAILTEDSPLLEVFRRVDRGFFLPPPGTAAFVDPLIPPPPPPPQDFGGALDLAQRRHRIYYDQPFRAGTVHLSAPHIYVSILEALQLENGNHFLNVGCGTGYLTILACNLIGKTGSVHGIDLFQNDRSKQFIMQNRSLCKHFLSESGKEIEEKIRIVYGDCHRIDFRLALNTGLYDRIYIGGACSDDLVRAYQEFLKPDGILVAPLSSGDLLKVVRGRGKVFEGTKLKKVGFCSLVAPPDLSILAQFLANTEPTLDPLASELDNQGLVSLPRNEWHYSSNLFYPRAFRQIAAETILGLKPNSHTNEESKCDRPKLKRFKPATKSTMRLPGAIWAYILTFSSRDWFNFPLTQLEIVQEQLENEKEANLHLRKELKKYQDQVQNFQREKSIYIRTLSQFFANSDNFMDFTSPNSRHPGSRARASSSSSSSSSSTSSSPSDDILEVQGGPRNRSNFLLRPLLMMPRRHANTPSYFPFAFSRGNSALENDAEDDDENDDDENDDDENDDDEYSNNGGSNDDGDYNNNSGAIMLGHLNEDGGEDSDDQTGDDAGDSNDESDYAQSVVQRNNSDAQMDQHSFHSRRLVPLTTHIGRRLIAESSDSDDVESMQNGDTLGSSAAVGDSMEMPVSGGPALNNGLDRIHSRYSMPKLIAPSSFALERHNRLNSSTPTMTRFISNSSNYCNSNSSRNSSSSSSSSSNSSSYSYNCSDNNRGADLLSVAAVGDSKKKSASDDLHSMLDDSEISLDDTESACRGSEEWREQQTSSLLSSASASASSAFFYSASLAPWEIQAQCDVLEANLRKKNGHRGGEYTLKSDSEDEDLSVDLDDAADDKGFSLLGPIRHVSSGFHPFDTATTIAATADNDDVDDVDIGSGHGPGRGRDDPDLTSASTAITQEFLDMMGYKDESIEIDEINENSD